MCLLSLDLDLMAVTPTVVAQDPCGDSPILGEQLDMGP